MSVSDDGRAWVLGAAALLGAGVLVRGQGTGSLVRPGLRLARKVGPEPKARGQRPKATVQALDPEDGVWVDVTAKVSPYHEARTTIRGIMPRPSSSAASEVGVFSRVHAAIRAAVPEADALLKRPENALVEVRLQGRQVDREYVGSRFDLAIAVAILAALGVIPTPPGDMYFVGGLLSDGMTRIVGPTNTVRIATDLQGVSGLVVAHRGTNVTQPDGRPMLSGWEQGRWGFEGIGSLGQVVRVARDWSWFFTVPF